MLEKFVDFYLAHHGTVSRIISWGFPNETGGVARVGLSESFGSGVLLLFSHPQRS
jgi:hypothetical protein